MTGILRMLKQQMAGKAISFGRKNKPTATVTFGPANRDVVNYVVEDKFESGIQGIVMIPAGIKIKRLTLTVETD